jgi:hypothetical protein
LCHLIQVLAIVDAVYDTLSFARDPREFFIRDVPEFGATTREGPLGPTKGTLSACPARALAPPQLRDQFVGAPFFEIGWLHGCSPFVSRA